MPEIEKAIYCAAARGQQPFDVQSSIRRHCGFHVPIKEIATIRKAQLKVILDWRSRSLSKVYAAIYFGSIRVKVLDPALRLTPLHMAVGITCDGRVQLIGAWTEPRTEIHYQDRWMEELRAHGVQDVLFALVHDDHQAGAVQRAFPLAQTVRITAKKTAKPTVAACGNAPADSDPAPDWVISLAASANLYSTLIGRVRRGGLKANTAFRAPNEALELLLVILQPDTIAWRMRAKSWNVVEKNLHNHLGQRLR